MARAGESSGSVFANLPLIFAMLLAAQPFVLIACGFAGAVAFLHRRFDPLVPIAVIGPILVFSIYGQYTSTTFGWFRYYITAVPLVVILALACWRPGPADIAKRHRRGTATWTRKASAALIAASTFIAGPSTFYATLDARIGNQQLQFGINSLLSPNEFTQEELWFRRLNMNERTIADYLDRKQLPPGSVLMDTFNTWAIWLASDRPQQFVITSDYDFISALNRPYESGVQYIIVSNPDVTAADAVTLRYPTFWKDGAGKAVYVMSIEGPTGEERFRVYKVVEPTPPPPSP